MKKRILAMVLALTMVFTFVSVSAATITESSTLKEVISEYVNGRGLDDIVVFVPLDIQLKDTTASKWEESLSIETTNEGAIPAFDFLATLQMSAVEDAFKAFVLKAGQAIEATAVNDAHKTDLYAALDAVTVTGTFTITIDLPDGIKFSEDYTTNNNMEEFNDDAKLIFEESDTRKVTNDGKTITLTIDVKDGQTKKTLENEIGKTITFEANDVDVEKYGTYKVLGKLEGETKIGDIATVKYETTPLGTDNGVEHNPDETKAPWASATIVASRKTSGGGGGVKTPAKTEEYKVDFVVDGSVVTTGETKSGKINVGTVTPTEKEGYDFAGWYYDAECTKPATGQITVKDDIKLYAKYVVAGIGDGPVLNAEDHGAYIIGYVDGTVRPLNNIVREEVAAIFFRLLTEAAGEAMHKEVAPYSDVPATKWSSTAIATLANGGYITGRPDGTFGPNDYITRAEFATIAARFTKSADGNGVAFSDVQGHWAKNYIEACAASGLITGYTDGTFKPDQFITRAEAMAIVNRMLGRAVDAEGIAAVKDDIYYFADNAENTWCYYIVLEATNAHDYTKAEDGTETWTKVTEVRDWTVYEK